MCTFIVASMYGHITRRMGQLVRRAGGLSNRVQKEMSGTALIARMQV